jgi:hypothetical protein
VALKVIQNEVDGWDVVREDEGVALSNHETRASAEEAARMRADEERLSEEGDEPVVVDTLHVHAIDDARQGVKPAFLALGGLLLGITILVAILSLTGALTGFGS